MPWRRWSGSTLGWRHGAGSNCPTSYSRYPCATRWSDVNHQAFGWIGDLGLEHTLFRSGTPTSSRVRLVDEADDIWIGDGESYAEAAVSWCSMASGGYSSIDQSPDTHFSPSSACKSTANTNRCNSVWRVWGRWFDIGKLS